MCPGAPSLLFSAGILCRVMSSKPSMLRHGFVTLSYFGYMQCLCRHRFCSYLGVCHFARHSVAKMDLRHKRRFSLFLRYMGSVQYCWQLCSNSVMDDSWAPVHGVEELCGYIRSHLATGFSKLLMKRGNQHHLCSTFQLQSFTK